MNNMADEEREVLYDSEMFKEDLSLIDSEITAIDNLYDEVKKHYDLVKNAPSRGSLSFVEKQTTNLVNLKTAKLNYIKQRIDAKKTLTDFKYKDKQIDIKQTSSESNSQFNEAIYNKIMETISYNAKSFNNNKDEEVINEEDIERELDESLDDSDLEVIDSIIKNDTSKKSASEDEEDTTEEIIQNDEDSDEDYVYDKSSGHFYKVDGDFNIIEDLGDNFDNIIEFYTEGEDEYALGDSDNTYLCVVIEDEEDE